QIVYAHMGMTAVVALAFAASFIRANSVMRARGASPSAIAANTSRYIGYVWTWGALCLLGTYATGILAWREWLHFTVACIILAALSLLFAAMLQKDADGGREDRAILTLGHRAAIVLLAGMVVTVAGFLIDGKMTRFLNPRFTDWAANNIFFFGALSIATIAGYALKHKQK